MTDKTCLYEDCNERAQSRGFCNKHYQRELRKQRAAERTIKRCAEDGCDREVRTERDLCARHHAKTVAREAAASRPSREPQPKSPCSVEGCDRTASRKGVCQNHYRKEERRKKDPLVGTRKPGPKVDHGAKAREEALRKEAAAQRREAKKRAQREATHCSSGHEFTEQTTGWRPDGSKKCKECERIQQAEYRKRQGAGKRVYRQEKTHCDRGHEYTPENTTLHTSPNTGTVSKRCRMCQRLRNIQNLYGLNEAGFFRMLKDQNDSCAICKRPFGDTRATGPHVDHNHETGKVRGILCSPCNTALGSFKDDPEILRAAIRYLADHENR